MKTITKAEIKHWMPSLNSNHYFIETVKRGKEYILTLYGSYNIEYLTGKADVNHCGTIREYKYTIKPK